MEMKTHYGYPLDEYTRCGKTSTEGARLRMSMNEDEVTCKTCLAALGKIKHPSRGRRILQRKRRKKL